VSGSVYGVTANDEQGFPPSPGTVSTWLQSVSLRLVHGDTNGRWDIFVRHVADRAVERVSMDADGGESNETATTRRRCRPGR
jgi:hypothetical protein